MGDGGEHSGGLDLEDSAVDFRTLLIHSTILAMARKWSDGWPQCADSESPWYICIKPPLNNKSEPKGENFNLVFRPNRPRLKLIIVWQMSRIKGHWKAWNATIVTISEFIYHPARSCTVKVTMHAMYMKTPHIWPGCLLASFFKSSPMCPMPIGPINDPVLVVRFFPKGPSCAKPYIPIMWPQSHIIYLQDVLYACFTSLKYDL